MKIYEEVKDAATIGISGHIRPDGDCIGAGDGSLSVFIKEVPGCADRGIFGTAGRGVFL